MKSPKRTVPIPQPNAGRHKVNTTSPPKKGSSQEHHPQPAFTSSTHVITPATRTTQPSAWRPTWRPPSCFPRHSTTARIC